MEYIKEPKQIGEIMRELFIIDDNGVIDHDMIVTLFNISWSDCRDARRASP